MFISLAYIQCSNIHIEITVKHFNYLLEPQSDCGCTLLCTCLGVYSRGNSVNLARVLCLLGRTKQMLNLIIGHEVFTEAVLTCLLCTIIVSSH
jgi:hypothetical protein